MDVTVKLQGLPELEARLQELDALAGQKLLRRVLRRIAKPMADRARANASTLSLDGSSGALARSVGIATRKEKSGQVARIVVTSRGRDKAALHLHNAFYRRRVKGIFYGWMVDQGHNTKAGRVGARPWWTPAVTASEGKAINDFVGELTKAIVRLERRKSKTASPDAVVPP